MQIRIDINKKTRTILIVLFILIGLTACLANYTYLTTLAEEVLQKQIGNSGYYGIAISVFLIELIPQPILSSWIPCSIGLLFNMNFFYIILISVASAIPANYIAYFIGTNYGKSMAHFFVSEANYEKSVKWFDKYGKKSISVLALLPLPYFPIMGGLFKMTFKEFTLYAIIPRIFHFILLLSVVMIFL